MKLMKTKYTIKNETREWSVFGSTHSGGDTIYIISTAS
jgi:hypothetical protein